jgi:transcriptional regulator with XRE-family HTH domain
MSEGCSKTGRFLLKEVLSTLGVSQYKLAKLMGRTQDWVGRIALEKQSPSWESVVRIARTLNVSVGVFCDKDPASLQFFQRGRAQHIDAIAARAGATAVPPDVPARTGRRPRGKKAS